MEPLDISKVSLLPSHQNDSSVSSLLDFYEVMDLDIVLSTHQNWPQIRQLPPLFIHDRPDFFDDSQLPNELWLSDEVEAERLKYSNKFSILPALREYRLLLFSIADPSQPLAFGSMDISIQHTWQLEGRTERPWELGIQLEFLHNYVVPAYRDLGLDLLLGYAMGDIFWRQINHVLGQLTDSDYMLRPIIIDHERKAGGSMIVDTVEREMRMMSKLHKEKELDFRLENTLVSFPDIAC
ncbi:hypothetical protein C2869_12400 [Saccharobesus litoralis]|uniref:Uncharacterized protein n=1 Tax=Saccharobesus litoralis TaxID=2172099 RepID=A0A2S0VSI9_9ALTE|nr:hypothetical protein [Saccharobesus litoralis]AWB67186.1 hypothetical protein C2869_12400 [Saccharobesus litoralis]